MARRWRREAGDRWETTREEAVGEREKAGADDNNEEDEEEDNERTKTEEGRPMRAWREERRRRGSVVGT